MRLPGLKEKDVEQLNNWLANWDEWRRERKIGRPDYTGDAIYVLPLLLGLLKSESTLTKLTYALIILTGVLAVETFLLVF